MSWIKPLGVVSLGLSLCHPVLAGAAGLFTELDAPRSALASDTNKLSASSTLVSNSLPAAPESLHAGFLYDRFRLTLEPGERTEILGPLYYHEQGESRETWAVPPLFSYTKEPGIGMTEFDILYPVLTYDRYGDQYRWQLGQLLSFAGGPMQDEPRRRRFTVFPLYFQQRSSNPNENYTAFVPFYGHLKHRLFRDDIFFVMFPLYSETRKKDVVTDNYLFPVFHLRHGPGLEGWQFWPLVGHEHKEVTTVTNGFNEVQTVPGHDEWFALWPIYFNSHTGLGTTNPVWQNAALPFYSIQRSPLRDSDTVLWPFFSRIDNREKKYREIDAPWPLVEVARGEGKNTTRVWPFFSRARSRTLEDDFYLWPVYKREAAHLAPLEHRRTRIAFFLYSNTFDQNSETGASRRSSYFWPLFTHRREFNGNTRLQLLAPLEPFVQGSHKIGRDYSPLWSVWRAEHNPRNGGSSQSLLWNLYRHETAPDHRRVSLLFGLYQSQSTPHGKHRRLFFIPLDRN